MSPFAKLSSLQWEILRDVIVEGGLAANSRSWLHDEAWRVARIRAITRLVARGILKREAGQYGGRIELAISEHALYDAALRARRRDDERGIGALDSPAWGVVFDLKRVQRRRRFLGKPRKAPAAMPVDVQPDDLFQLIEEKLLSIVGGLTGGEGEEASATATPSPGRINSERGAVASALQYLSQQKPEGDIDPQAIVDFLAMSTITKNVALMHLATLKSSGEYARILAKARTEAAKK